MRSWPCALLIPLALGALAAAICWLLPAAVPVFYARADAATLALLLGALGSLAAAGMWAVRRATEARCRADLAAYRLEGDASHRRFIRRLDHEIKNPLTAISAGLANLRADDGTAVTSMRAQVDRLARLTAQLRKLADLETQPLEQESVDLTPLLEDLLALMREGSEAEARQVQLSVPRAPWPLPPVHGDRDLLFVALHNLLDNAIKFSRPSDTIELRAFEDGNRVVIEVADTGPGIPGDELPHLGEELYRGRSAGDVPGSGLGLALARAIVARHGGTLTIRSRVDQGTVVTVRLPAMR